MDAFCFCRHAVSRRQLLSAAFYGLFSLIALPLAADEKPCRPAVCTKLPRPQDQIWLVSDRSLGCGEVDAKATNLKYWHYLPNSGWQTAKSQEFFASDDPDRITHIWIHGNRIDSSDAYQVGWTVYRALARRAPDDRPLRFVIWSWPSEQVQGLMQDVRVKAARTGPSAFHLARFIDAMGADVPVSLSGYSYGARIITGALHLMGGGRLNGRKLAFNTADKRPKMDVVLLAAALDNTWVLPGHCHGRALSMMNRLLLINNSCDQALKRYHWIYGRRSCAEALGYTGLVGGNQLGADRAKIMQFDACCYVGREHNWRHYFCCPAVVERMVPYVFSLPSSKKPQIETTYKQ